ncbi:UNVERIFIED_CONTAM: hypothetical protein FKN15_056999 [Acipenser sinensis]
MAGLLFASHPVHTEAVAGIVGRADVGAALFFLLSLLCYMRHCSLRGHSAHCLPWLLGSFACAACSMLWKEQGVTVLAVSAVYDVFVFHGLKFHQVISLLFKYVLYAWGNLGNVLKSQGKMAEAEQAYRNALYYRSNMADMLYNLGLLLQENSKFSEALHYYKLAIGSRPTLASAYLNTGIILMNQGRLDEAKRTFLTCAEIPDENLKDPHAHQSSVTSCLYNLGKLFYERGQIEEALSAYKKAIQKMPRQFAGQSLYNMMGEAYMRLNKLTEAEHCYLESLRAKPDHIPAHLTYGKLLALTGHKLEAEQYFLKAIQLDPTKGNCYMHYGQFLLEESRLLEAAEMAGKAAELDSTEFDVVFNAAHMLRQASLNEAAEKYYRLAAGLRPDDLDSLSHALKSDAFFKGAMEINLCCVCPFPDKPVSMKQLRNIIDLQQAYDPIQASLNEAAEKYYRLAAGLRPDYPAALMNLGAILHLNGKLEEAEVHYLQALQLKLDDTITQSNLRKLWNIMEKQGLKTLGTSTGIEVEHYP